MIQLDLPGWSATIPTGRKGDTKKGSEGSVSGSELPLCLYQAIVDSEFFLYFNDRGNRRFIPMVCYSVSRCERCFASLKPQLDLGDNYHAKKRKSRKPSP